MYLNILPEFGGTPACLSEACSQQNALILTTPLVNVQDSFNRLANPTALPIK